MKTRILLILTVILLLPWNVLAVNNKYRVDNSFYDQISGKDFYLLNDSENVFKRKIIIHNKNNDEWSWLDGNYFWFSQNWHRNCYPMVELDINNLLYLDTINYKLIEGNQYDKSPDENWGYLENVTYGNSISKYRILLKNFNTGEINLFLETDSSISLDWLDDSRLLINKYSKQRKQYEIVVYDPKNNTYTDIVLGRLYRFSKENNLILYVKNEPLRQRWILDLKTGKERLLANETEEKELFKQINYSRIADPPPDLDINNLKVITPFFDVKNEHLLTFNGIETPVYYAFKYEGNLFIPVRPLMNKFNVKIDKSETGNYLINYHNQLSLTNENSTIFQNRLFVTSDVLKIIGLPEFSIASIK